MFLSIGNRFYQQPNPNGELVSSFLVGVRLTNILYVGGRPKRFVEYKDSYRDLSEYTARASLPGRLIIFDMKPWQN